MSLVSLKKPDASDLERVIQAQRDLPVTYGGSLMPTPGFRYQRTLEPLGYGPHVWERAVSGLEAWAVYPPWITLQPNRTPVREGGCAALLTGLAPVWVVSVVRVVEVGQTPIWFGFTLGTLPQHALSGLERFSVSLGADERVWYEIMAVSRPRHPLVKLGALPLRFIQARFARDSARSLQSFTERDVRRSR